MEFQNLTTEPRGQDGGRRRSQCNFENSTGRRPVEQAQHLTSENCVPPTAYLSCGEAALR